MVKSAIIADDDVHFRENLAGVLRRAVTDAKIDEVPDGESLVKKVQGGGGLMKISADY
ncbi:hypothetical protein HYV85_04270 [Candidatus Woesearchaeota archaeon]|nr:hypothetical protein [Candidatus Woesearchaeota archaeon]